VSGRVLILYTHWEPEDYWEQPREAPYPGRSYRELPEWDELAKSCPLPALGVYTKGRLKKDKYVDRTHKEFVYLRLLGMRFDRESGQPYFLIEPISRASRPSREFLKSFPATNLFAVVDGDRILAVLRALGEEPPEDWVKLIGTKRFTISWRDYVGKYFLDLIDENLSNDDFEDRCWRLLVSLGFEVEQLGHKVIGEYPDGEATLDDVVIVYDCKNISEYNPSAEDKRKLNGYVQDAKLKHKDKIVYGMFIAKSFDAMQTGDLFYVPVSSLVYLLYKKLMLGRRFSLSPFRKILAKKERIDETLIDNEWREP